MRDNFYQRYVYDLESVKKALKEVFDMDLPSLEEIQTNKEIQAKIIFATEPPSEFDIQEDKLFIYWGG